MQHGHLLRIGLQAQPQQREAIVSGWSQLHVQLSGRIILPSLPEVHPHHSKDNYCLPMYTHNHSKCFLHAHNHNDNFSVSVLPP